jgi:ribonuclease T2
VKTLFYILVTTTYLLARFDAQPSKGCEAYNNMKHTKNTHHIVLDTKKSYTVLKHHKGQNLILVKGENPSQRWVDENCFDRPKSEESSKDSTENMQSMEAELARLEKDMETTLSPKAKKRKSLRNNVSKKDKVSLSMEDELASLEKELQKTLYPNKKQVTASKQNLLALSWHNAFCETHRYKKECKRGFGSLLRSKSHEEQFVLHGLWPQPRNKIYCNVSNKNKALDKKRRWSDLPSLKLDEEFKIKLSIVMPGFTSYLHRHEWIKHGTCYGTDANTYYGNAMSLVEQFNKSSLASFFKVSKGKRVTLTQIKKIVQKEFGRGASKSIALQCKGGLITEVWLQLGSGADDLATLLKRGKKLYSRCKSGHIDKAGFGR